MVDSASAELRSVLDHVEISRLHAAYADVVNRRAWSELEALFLPDAVVRVDTVTGPVIEAIGPRQLGRFIGDAIERFAFMEFVILSARIELPRPGAPDDAAARLYMSEVRRDVGTLAWSVAYGIYQDRFRRTAGGWRFARRDYQSLTRTGGEVFPFPRLHPQVSSE